MRTLAFAFCGLLSLAASAATSIYVDSSRGTAGGDGSWESPFATIQQALVYAQSNGGKDIIISVQPGTYDGPVIFSSGGSIYDYSDGRGYADRWSGKKISLRGRTHDIDNDDPDLVTITGHDKTNCLMVAGSSASVANIRCMNGSWGHWDDADPVYQQSPGGILINSGANVSNCHVTACCIDPKDAPKRVNGAGVLVRNGTFQYSKVTNCRGIQSAGGSLSGVSICHNSSASLSKHILISNCVAEVTKNANGDMSVVGLGINCGMMDAVHIVDCYSTNSVYPTRDGGPVLYFEHDKSIITNCLFERCWTLSDGSAIRGGYGGRIYDTTVRNCSGGTPISCTGSDQMVELERMTRVRGLRVCGCTNVSMAALFNGVILQDCVFEDNDVKSYVLAYLGGKPKPLTNRVENVVVRNNRSAGHIVCSGYSDSRDCRIQGCWILNNTSTGTGAALYNNYSTYNCLFRARECVIAGNTCAYGIYTGSKGYPVASDWPYGSYSWVDGCTIADNTFSRAAIYCDNSEWGGSNILDRVTFTNCLVAANNGSTPLNANFAKGPVGAVAYSLFPSLDNLPADTEGKAHNVAATATFSAGGYRPARTCAAVDAGFEFPYMRASDYRALGNGLVDVTYVGNGVRVTPRDANRKRLCARIHGDAPDIGACESVPRNGAAIVVR